MNFYGGTPLGYACCFSLKHAAKAILDTRLITLDSPGARCEVSGFLPLHAVTANGLMGDRALSTALVQVSPSTRCGHGREVGVGV